MQKGLKRYTYPLIMLECNHGFFGFFPDLSEEDGFFFCSRIDNTEDFATKELRRELLFRITRNFKIPDPKPIAFRLSQAKFKDGLVKNISVNV